MKIIKVSRDLDKKKLVKEYLDLSLIHIYVYKRQFVYWMSC